MVPAVARAAVDAGSALRDVAEAIACLERVRTWAVAGASDHPGGEDRSALAAFAHAWAVRLGMEVVDAYAHETDLRGVLDGS